MTALIDFFPYVLPDVAGCPDPTALNAIRLACEEFYSRTQCKRVTLADITTVADTAEYALTLPAGFVVAKAIEVWLDDSEIDPIGMDDRNSLIPGWKTQTGTPDYYYLPDTANIGMFMTPGDVYTVSVEAILKPAATETTIDDWIFEQYREDIAAGALHRLMGMSNKPWSSPLAGSKRQQFNDAIGKATTATNKGHTRAPKRTRAVFGLR